MTVAAILLGATLVLFSRPLIAQRSEEEAEPFQSGSESTAVFESTVRPSAPEARHQHVCGGGHYDGQASGGMTLDEEVTKSGNGWLVVTEYITELMARWTSRFTIPAGGPYRLRMTSIGRATAGEESDTVSHGHKPSSGWSRLDANRDLSAHFSSQSKVEGKRYKRVTRHEWDLRLYGKYQYRDDKGSHTESTPMTLEMEAIGPGSVEVSETFRLAQVSSTSAKDHCGWAEIVVVFDPLKWELFEH